MLARIGEVWDGMEWDDNQLGEFLLKSSCNSIHDGGGTHSIPSSCAGLSLRRLQFPQSLRFSLAFFLPIVSLNSCCASRSTCVSNPHPSSHPPTLVFLFLFLFVLFLSFPFFFVPASVFL